MPKAGGSNPIVLQGSHLRPALPSSPGLLHTQPSSHRLPRFHTGTCKFFPTDVGADIDAGVDGVRVLALADCLLLVRQLGRVFLGRKKEGYLDFWEFPFPVPVA